MKQFFLGLLLSVIVIASALVGALADRLFVIKPLDALSPRKIGTVSTQNGVVTYSERSGVIDIFDQTSPSVVTVGVTKTQNVPGPINTNLGMEMMFGFGQSGTGKSQQSVDLDIGTGFVVDKNLIVTNKHVVLSRSQQYKVIDKDNKEYQVKNIYRDPGNDLAILEVEGADKLVPLTLGESSELKVGQFVVAIGTALGKYRHTVTTGVISGLGRGISAGDPLEGFVEKLENVIQTDAAINPGNSGGPLLNGAGQVIGVNVAVADNAQNVGFAIPIDIIRESLKNFNDTGKFDRAFLGVTYQYISREVAILNEIPQGAYVRGTAPDSPASKAGVMPGDIIVSLDGTKLTDENGGLANLIDKKKIGESVKLKIWRNGTDMDLTAVLEQQNN
jgi:serine protease Do